MLVDDVASNICQALLKFPPQLRQEAPHLVVAAAAAAATATRVIW
jgi:hypothetical protein